MARVSDASAARGVTDVLSPGRRRPAGNQHKPSDRASNLGDQLANERDQLGAVSLSVIERLVAANEETAGAELVVGQECLRDRIGSSNKCGRVAARARRLGELHPQAGIMHLGRCGCR